MLSVRDSVTSETKVESALMSLSQERQRVVATHPTRHLFSMHVLLACACAGSLLAVHSATGCPSDGLCSLNGVCTQTESGTVARGLKRGLAPGVPSQRCVCDDGWMLGPDLDCSRLDLLPAPSAVSFHGLDENKSSWGGSVLRLPDAAGKPQFAMFAAEV